MFALLAVSRAALFAGPDAAGPRLSIAPGFKFRASGFRVEKIAGSSEAYDIQCLTLDARGRVVVSGPGYIRTLIDSDGDGYLETVRETYRGPTSGAQGLLADAGGLYFVGGRGLERLEDADGDGRADGPARLVFPIRTGGEHHSHALRRGHDGHLYFLLGNHAGFEKSRIRGTISPVADPYAGLLVRLRPDVSTVEVIAQGMRNAYDFDFDAAGEIFAWDSDGERDEGLPWYRPCRLYHLTPGADCGWRSSGSGKVPNYALDTIAPVAEVGRGSPTGVVVYRHTAFPERFQGGVFTLDWTFGRILFFPLEEDGGTFHSDWEEFVTSSETTPFAPTDVEVAPDGALIVSSGGRGLFGSVYRIRYIHERESLAGDRRPKLASAPLDEVLRAPMPLAAWSRSRWIPVAGKIPARDYFAALRDSSRPIAARVRALDVLLDLGLVNYSAVFAAVLQHPETPEDRPVALRMRSAWWAGRARHAGALRFYLRDPHPRVVRTAIEGTIPLLPRDDQKELTGEVFRLAAHPVRRVRQAVAYALAHAPRDHMPRGKSSREHLVRGLAAVLRSPRGRVPESAVDSAVAALRGTSSVEDILDALRLTEIAFERVQRGHDPNATFYEGWESVDLAPWRSRIEALAPELRRAAHAANPFLSREGTRLLSLLRVHGDATVDTVLDRITLSSPPGEDILTLSFAALLPGPWEGARLDRLADALLGVSRKVRAGKVGRDRRWHRYMSTAAVPLFDRHSGLSDRLLERDEFGDPDHVTLANAMERKAQRRAAAIFARLPLPAAVDERRSVLGFLARFPETSRAILRGAFDAPALRSIALKGLSRDPQPEDRALFMEALDLGDRNVVSTAVDGLLRLPVPAAGTLGFSEVAAAFLRWGFILDSDLTHRATLDKLAEALRRMTGTRAGYRRGSKDSQRSSFEAWAKLVTDDHADFAAAVEEILAAVRTTEARWAEVLEKAPWSEGDVAAGAAVFEKYACNACHHLGGKGVRVGPDLAGLAKRFSLEDIVTAIGLPDRQVAPRYRSEVLLLKNGERLEGLPLYDSRGAMLFQARDGQFRRVAAAEIAERLPQARSLMPTGYLETMSLREIADLLAYLRREK